MVKILLANGELLEKFQMDTNIPNELFYLKATLLCASFN